MVGQNIGKYRVLDRVGRGGMGTVYRALDETLHREVAIKVLNAELNDPEVAKRFRAEAITVARLSHPGIATIYELFQHEGQWLMVMEFVRGETLEHMVDRMGALSPQRSAELCMQALAALAHAHSMGVVHRDLKPANMMITETGAVKIMDFGIARVAGTEHLTNVGFMMGTPAYMAPEQVRGEELDARADLYSMGVVFYRLTTAKLPFKGETPFAMAQSQVNDPPTPVGMVRSDLPPWVEPVVARSLSKRPEERFQSAAEFHEAFARCLAGLPFTTMYGNTGQTELITPLRTMPTGSLSMRGVHTGSLPTMMAPSAAPSQRMPTGSPSSGAVPAGPSSGAVPGGPSSGAVPAGPSSGAVPTGPSSGALRSGAVPTDLQARVPAASEELPATVMFTTPPVPMPSPMARTAAPAPVADPPAAPTASAQAAGAAAQTVAQKPGQKPALAQKQNPNKKNATVLVAGAVGLLLVAALGAGLILRNMRQQVVQPPPAVVTEPAPTPEPPPATTTIDPAALPATPAVPDPGAPPAVTPGSVANPVTTVPPPTPPPVAMPPAGTKSTKGTTTAPAPATPPVAPVTTPPVTTATPPPVAPVTPAPAPPPTTGSTPTPAPVNDPLVSFPSVKILSVSGKNTADRDVDLQFASGQLTVLPSAGGAAYGSINYKAIAKATYIRARDPKWDTSLPSPPQGLDVGSAFRLSRHWLVIQTTTGFTILRLEDNNFARILATIEARTGVKVDRRASTDK